MSRGEQIVATPGGAAETSALPLCRGGGGSAVPPSPSAESKHEQREKRRPPRLSTPAVGVALSVGTSTHGLMSIAVVAPTRHER